MVQSALEIHYYDSFDESRVPEDRNLFVPLIEGVNWDDWKENYRRERALIVKKHMVNNETFHKSEYAWEADAWADIFGRMRSDNRLAV